MHKFLSSDEYISTAFDIGAKLARDAVWHEGRCTWISYFKVKKSHPPEIYKSSIGSNIAKGNAGILLFLSQLANYFQDPIILKTLQGCRNQLLYKFDADKKKSGYFNGSFGELSLLLNTCDPNSENENTQDYLNIASDILSNNLERGSLSYTKGLVGIIEPLIQITSTYQDEQLLNGLHQILDKLLKKIKSTNFDKLSYLGYTKSKAGALVEMLRLAEFLQNSDASKHIISKFNDTLKSSSFNFNKWSYIHLQSSGHPEFNPHSAGWNKGLAGLTESKLSMYEMTEDLRHKKYAKIAAKQLSQTAASSIHYKNWFSNFSYNHGLAGIGSVLIKAARVLKKSHFLNDARNVGDYGIQHIHRNDFDWPSGIYAPNIFGSLPAHGFLNGITGTGMFYLDLYTNVKELEEHLNEPINAQE